MLIPAKVERSILWLTVSKAADRSRRIRTEASASVTARSAVSVECPDRKPDW
uniref:Uncharacterized protein n=1 Tax=Anguilla anguilla TaxID=7936 RepID=A0A0E9UDV4_ANGAN